MDLIALAVPFFLLAIIVEMLVNRQRRAGVYRSNDAINSISAGMLDTTTGYFTKFLPLLAWGLVLENFAIIDMPLAWFDDSPRGIALWVVAAVAWDFCYYWLHRFSHEISILWAAHAVHHQSEEYNLSTALRQTSTGFLFGWIFYLPLFVIGFPLEILVAVNAINLIYQFWVHTRLIARLGPLEKVLMTPSHHRVHHAQNERYIDKNYGGMLILWDRLFGTYEPGRWPAGTLSGPTCRSTTTCCLMHERLVGGRTSWVSGSGAPDGAPRMSRRATRRRTWISRDSRSLTLWCPR